MSNQLTDLQEKVFSLFEERGGAEIGIFEIYCVAYGTTSNPHERSNRELQQKLGPVISRINKKLKHGRIEPGREKRTYRYITPAP